MWQALPDLNLEVTRSGRVRRASDGYEYSRSDQGRYTTVVMRRGGRQRVFYVHRLILEAFVGPAPEGYEANHKNGKRRDNRLGNLEWVTPQRNKQHAKETGLMTGPRGERCHTSRLTEREVIRLRKLWDTGRYTAAQLAERFDIGESTAYFAATRRSWKHVG